ncbi:MAG TPA: hypothetical protein VJ696_09780 [Rhodanobacteraceae bacterium]|nr:hypothetical protein [Rhodanobacteraceae bacterium]
MRNTIIVAATFALAIGTGALVAQTAAPPPTAPPSDTNPPPMSPPATPPTNTNPSMTPRSNMQPQANRPGMPSSTMPPDFTTLDRTGAGYLTQQDAAMNPWLKGHFTMCDTDKNGQVTRAEYTGCAKNP